MFDQCEVLGTGSEVAFIGVFRIVMSVGSVGVDADEGVVGHTYITIFRALPYKKCVYCHSC